jgi:hypothetical protein
VAIATPNLLHREMREAAVAAGKHVLCEKPAGVSAADVNEFDCDYFDVLHGAVGAVPERAMCRGGITVYRDGRDTWDHAAAPTRPRCGCTRTFLSP